MAEFSGKDVVEVELPGWCRSVESLGSLWIDFWLCPSSYNAQGAPPTLLLAGMGEFGMPSLLWTMEGVAGSGGVAGAAQVRLSCFLHNALVLSFLCSLLPLCIMEGAAGCRVRLTHFLD